MKKMKLAALVTAVSLASSGCALTMEALAHHNSGGTACIDSTAFGGIDLLIAALTTAAVATSDESPGYYAVPGVFAASGIIGTISAIQCRGDDNGGSESNAPPASNTAPSFGDAPVDPEAREATHEEMFGTGQPTTTVPLLKNGIPTGIVPPEEPAKKPDPLKPVGEPKPMTCKVAPSVPCPDGYWCQLVEENTGQCVPMK